METPPHYPYTQVRWQSTSQQLPSNILLLCTFSKVLKHIVFNRLNDFISEHETISTNQFGFKKYHSTMQQLLLFLNKVTSYIDSNARCDTIYLDFSIAFGSVPHNELLVKLRRIGVTNNVWYWLREYLYNRKQYVSINGCYSNLLPVISGVPQGSILGPLLFVLYVTDIPFNKMYSSIFLFADDTNYLQPIQSIPADMLHLQEDHDLLSSWSHDWKLHFNEIKCLLLQIHNRLSNSTAEAQPLMASITTTHYVLSMVLHTTR